MTVADLSRRGRKRPSARTPEFRAGPPRRRRTVTLIHARTRNPRREIASRSAIQAAAGAPACPQPRLGSAVPRGKEGSEKEGEKRDTGGEGGGRGRAVI